MPSLQMFSPVLAGAVYIHDFSSSASGYWHSIRAQGGYWQAGFRYIDKPAYLSQIYHEYLGAHFEEKSGGFKTWEGMLYEIDLTTVSGKGDHLYGVTRRRSLDLFADYVTATYIKPDDTSGTTAEATNDAAIARFGRKEELLTLDGFSQEAAEAERDRVLKENNWPWSRVVSAGPMSDEGAEAFLDMTFCGYVFTANWRYESAGDGSTDDLSNYLADLIGTDCEFLNAGKIEENTYQVLKDTKTPQLTFDVISNLVGLGKGASPDIVPTRFHVGNDRLAHYETIDTTPIYYLRGGRLYTSAGSPASVDKWGVKPAVVRDLSYAKGGADYDAWLGDARDFYVSEVEANDGSDEPVLKTDLFDESDMIAAQKNYQKMLEEEISRQRTEARKRQSKRKRNKIKWEKDPQNNPDYKP